MASRPTPMRRAWTALERMGNRWIRTPPANPDLKDAKGAEKGSSEQWVAQGLEQGIFLALDITKTKTP